MEQEKKKKRCGEKSTGIGGREKIKIKDQEKKVMKIVCRARKE